MTVRNRNPLFALVAAAGAVLAVPAFAQQTQPEPQTQQNPATPVQQGTAADAAASGNGQSWDSLDTDGDGAVSRAEAQAHAGLASVFDAADADKDGTLTSDEYRAYTAAQQR
ncbi:Calcium-binding EF-hand-containing protein [uncultured Stenotrophomonas sp.]|uniref:Calcium-binding EF-hand-containing protein n=1 Tax=uncultured Stenotrophomonas sp. TaxID=165438 RepID=A0A1Y5Q828_9GAMM|nr:Calcium-binding EF-hand-containing protein [uncultured Stenotrophomonas sp.]